MKATTTVLLAALVLLLSWEVYTIANPAQGDTISEVIWHYSRIPVIPFGFGFVCGHFFWQRKATK